jgi:poly-gamma-glutamate capsule biosynthesis protein CapA/YwtB (metallophosphatase superfamily)
MAFTIRAFRLILRKIIIGVVFLLADLTGIWRYPFKQDIYSTPKNRLAKLNWLYNSIHPVTRAEKNSGLEDYFVRQRDPVVPLLPEGFQPEQETCLSAVGDLMRAHGLENSQGKLYASIADRIFGADVSFANLESTVIEIDESEKELLYVFVTQDEYEAFKGHAGQQFTVFSTANNHILDGGVQGVNSVHAMLEADGFRYIGTNPTREHRNRGVFIDSSGIRLGFVAATYGINNTSLSRDKGYLVNRIPFSRDMELKDLSVFKDQIDWCQNVGCDFVVASLHWGHEFEFFPRRYQLQIAHNLIELGADAIIGHHSHTMQPYEIYQTLRDPDRRAPILYSLGNLVSWSGAAYRCLSMIAQLGVVKGLIGGEMKTLVANLDILPVLQVEHQMNGLSYLQLDALGDLVRSAHDDRVRNFTDEAIPYADLVLGKRWREDNYIHHA